jgi:hypothetical protein
MKCGKIQLLLPDFVQGLTLDTETENVKEHLSHCSSCLDEVRQLTELMAGLKLLRPPSPSSTYWNTLLVKVHDRVGRQSTRMIPEWIIRFAAPATAALVLMLVILSGNILTEGTVDSDLHAVVSSITGDELQQLADQTALSSDIISSSSTESSPETSDDVDVLKQLLASEDQTAIYSELDADDAVGVLTESEQEKLFSSLQQQVLTN